MAYLIYSALYLGQCQAGVDNVVPAAAVLGQLQVGIAYPLEKIHIFLFESIQFATLHGPGHSGTYWRVE